MADGDRRDLVYVGCYTPDSSGAGHGTGIAVFRRDPATGALAPAGPTAATPGPSFLATDPDRRYLFAVAERPDGGVRGFAIGPDGTLAPTGPERPTGGADPCHLTLDPSGGYLIVANYTSGAVSVHPVADGAVGERSDLVQHSGRDPETPPTGADEATATCGSGSRFGPDPDRQDGPHAHEALFDPAGEHLLVNDLGTDRVHGYRLAGGRLVAGPVSQVPPGTGPRHLVFDGSTIWLAGELAATVGRYRYADGALSGPDAVAPSTGRPEPRTYPSEIALSPDGRYLYVANRGADTVTVFADGTPVQEVDTGGAWPRHLALVGGHVYVANQNSDTVTVFARDPESGRLTPAGDPVPVPSPACVLAL